MQQDWPPAGDEQKGGNGLIVRLPWKLGSVEVRGVGVLLALVLVLSVGLAVGGVLHDRDQRRAIDEMREQMHRLVEAQQEIAYLLTLTPEQREALRLQMPDSLRRRLR